jgi:hypothetical protein
MKMHDLNPLRRIRLAIEGFQYTQVRRFGTIPQKLLALENYCRES